MVRSETVAAAGDAGKAAGGGTGCPYHPPAGSSPGTDHAGQGIVDPAGDTAQATAAAKVPASAPGPAGAND